MRLNSNVILTILLITLQFLAGEFILTRNRLIQFQRASHSKLQLSKLRLAETQSITNDARSKVGSIDDAKYMFDASGLSYCSKSKIKEYRGIYSQRLSEKFRPLEVFYDNVNEMQAYVASHSGRKEIIVVFRGSVNDKNWVRNFEVNQVPFNKQLNVLVHSGFNTIMNAMEPDLLNYLIPLFEQKQYQYYSLVFTGHSLGASIATLATAKLPPKLNLPWEKVKLFTYGSPRVGNRAFANLLNSKPIQSTRVVNNNDPVPKLPDINYVHIHTEIFIKGEETLICETSTFEDPYCSKAIPFGFNSDAHNTAFNVTKSENNC